MTRVHVEAEKNTRNVTVSRTPFEVPGFLASASASGMRYKERLDLAMIASEGAPGAMAAGVFTTNRFCAAPVQLCRDRLDKGPIRAIVVNAGIANACTGEDGLDRARAMARMAAQQLEAPEESILVSSTGVIGQQLRLEPVEEAMPALVTSLRSDGWKDVARAIMTTDTVPKMAWARVEIGGKPVTIGGVAKGAGMIAPNMATLLTFACTDAALEPSVLRQCVRAAADQSFNCITIDGDTSTNDTLLVLAGGKAGNVPIRDLESEDGRRFAEALTAVLLDLSIQIVADGEGATKLITIDVVGASDEAAARAVAMTIANSPLVKTAFFGEDANWGRIVAAAGRAGVELIPERVALFFDEVCVFQAGTPLGGAEVEERATRVFKQKEIRVRLDLGMGDARFSAYTCDFSYDYVKINADYRT